MRSQHLRYSPSEGKRSEMIRFPCTAQMLSNEQIIHFKRVFTNKSVSVLSGQSAAVYTVTRGVFTLMTGNE